MQFSFLIWTTAQQQPFLNQDRNDWLIVERSFFFLFFNYDDKILCTCVFGIINYLVFLILDKVLSHRLDTETLDEDDVVEMDSPIERIGK